MKRVAIIALGSILVLLALYFIIAGTRLAWFGGSWYYVLAGLALALSGVWIGRGDARGRWLFAGLWLATLGWTIWEVGFDLLQWIPRLAAPTVLLVLVLLTGWHRRAPLRCPALAAGATTWWRRQF